MAERVRRRSRGAPRWAGPLAAVATALLVVGCGRTERPPEANLLLSGSDTPAGEAAAARDLYPSQCAGCHGADGEGGFGPTLVDTELTDDVGRVMAVITDGRRGMPAFGQTLPEAAIRDLATYVVVELGEEPLGGVAPATTTPTAGGDTG